MRVLRRQEIEGFARLLLSAVRILPTQRKRAVAGGAVLPAKLYFAPYVRQRVQSNGNKDACPVPWLPVVVCSARARQSQLPSFAHGAESRLIERPDSEILPSKSSV